MRTLVGIAILGFLAAGCPAAGPAGTAPLASRAVASEPLPTLEVTPVPVGATASPDQSPGAADPDLASGVRADLSPCEPLSLDLASTASDGIQCRTSDTAIESVAIVRYPTEAALIAAYLARLEDNSIAVRTHAGRCERGRPSEGAYAPGDGGPQLMPDRSGCYVDQAGRGQYVATIAGTRLMISVTGTAADPLVLEAWAWRGNQDAPGNPTVWSPPPPSDTNACVTRSIDYAAGVRGAKGDPLELTRSAVSGVLPSDGMESSADSTANDVAVVITREDREIGRVHFVRDAVGGWVLTDATLCDGLGLS